MKKFLFGVSIAAANRNYIAKVLRTGMQWSELQDYIVKDKDVISELHYTTHGMETL
jgi:hypothetical protein